MVPLLSNTASYKKSPQGHLSLKIHSKHCIKGIDNFFWLNYCRKSYVLPKPLRCTQNTIQLWCCVSFLVLAGNSFWCYVRTQCTIQLCSCVSFWLWREIDLKMRTRFYKKILLGYFFLLLHISFLYCQSCRKCEHRQSHFDFLNNSYWVSFFKRNNLLAKI